MNRLLLILFIFSASVTFGQRLTEKKLFPDTEWACMNCDIRKTALSKMDTIELLLDNDGLETNSFTVFFDSGGTLEVNGDLRNAAFTQNPLYVDSTIYQILVTDSLLTSETFRVLSWKFGPLEAGNIHSISRADRPEEKFHIRVTENGFLRLYGKSIYVVNADLDGRKWQIDSKKNELVLVLKEEPYQAISYSIRKKKGKHHILLIRTGWQLR